MKKMLIGVTLTALLVIIGGVWVVEAVPPQETKEKTFEEMLPFMKKMHPDVSDETIKAMYDACHDDVSSHGHMTGSSEMKNMMKERH